MNIHFTELNMSKYITMWYLPNKKFRQISLELEFLEYTGVVEHKMV